MRIHSSGETSDIYPIVEDKNGDGIIDVNDSYMDNTLPKLYFGFGNTFTWKNFDLDIFMYGQLGVKKWNDAYGNSIDVGGPFEIMCLKIQRIQTHIYSGTFTLSHYNAVWIERMPNYDYQKYQKRKNEPMNAFYYYKTTGIINVDKSNMPESQRSLGPAACMPGYPIVEDKNGDGIIDVNDSYMDNMLPKLYFGFGNTFTWKNFDLDILLLSTSIISVVL